MVEYEDNRSKHLRQIELRREERLRNLRNIFSHSINRGYRYSYKPASAKKRYNRRPKHPFKISLDLPKQKFEMKGENLRDLINGGNFCKITFLIFVIHTAYYCKDCDCVFNAIPSIVAFTVFAIFVSLVASRLQHKK
jgi:hypothetical protein